MASLAAGSRHRCARVRDRCGCLHGAGPARRALHYRQRAADDLLRCCAEVAAQIEFGDDGHLDEHGEYGHQDHIGDHDHQGHDHHEQWDSANDDHYCDHRHVDGHPRDGDERNPDDNNIRPLTRTAEFALNRRAPMPTTHPTGRSVLSAVAGTAAGIVIGAGLVIAIGTDQGVLWAVLPLALLLAAYAPRAISFAVGQAGFTVFVVVLFNLLAAVGWRVGLVRAEDVAIGFAISLGVGLLFWPRGAAALVRQDLAMAYERAADSLVAAARQLIDGRNSDDAAPAARAADVAGRRLDEAFRQYLGERSATPVNVEDIAALVSGASRVRRAAQSLTSLARMANGNAQLDGCGRNLDRELGALQTWYSAFGFALMSGGALPPPHIHDEEDARQLLSCVRDAGQATANAALALLVAGQHLDNLAHLETLLSDRANAIRTASEDTGALGRLRVLAS